MIREIDADLVGLQEVDTGLRCDGLDQLDWLARATGRLAVLGPCRETPGGHYGNAALLRREPLAVRRHDLSVPGREPRGALELQLPFGPLPLTVVITHLGLKQSERRVQAERLLAALLDREGPLVVMGDFNDWRPGRPARGFLEARLGPGSRHPTYPALWPLFALDQLFARPAGIVRRLYTLRSPAARLASDHLPLVAELMPTINQKPS